MKIWMRKLVCLLLVALMMVSALPLAMADTAAAFVVDGVLDDLYLSDAKTPMSDENDYHFSSLNAYKKANGAQYQDNETCAMVYTAYDDNYVYFYVKVWDDELVAYDTAVHPDSSFADSLEIWFDPDPYTATHGEFFNNTMDANQGDIQLRFIPNGMMFHDYHNKVKPGYGNTIFGSWIADASNFKAFTFSDELRVIKNAAGNDFAVSSGYGVEARFPRVPGDDSDMYQFNIVANNSSTDDNTRYSLAIGPNWWTDYDSTHYVMYSDVNPFFSQGTVTFPSLNCESYHDVAITTGGQTKYVTFTPDADGSYAIYSDVEEDTRVSLYDAQGALLATDDDSGTDYNFRLKYNLVAGQTYMYGIQYYDSSITGTIPVYFGRVYDDFTFEIANHEATVTGFYGKETTIAIPAMVDGCPVTAIGYGAFSSAYQLVGVTIPDSVTTIADYAFSKCSKLATVNIPDSVVQIGKRAFYGCYSLASVSLPASVAEIGDKAFYDCDGLTKAVVGNGAVTLGNYAFYDCDRLSSLTLGGATAIGDYAFYDCDRLSSVTFPDSLTTIGSRAFFDCDKLTAVTITKGITKIGEGAFAGCDKVTAFGVDSTNTAFCVVDGVLFNKAKTTLLQYPTGKTVTSYTVPNGVTRIGGLAFAYCKKLADLSLPDSVTAIGAQAIYKTAYYNDKTNWDGEVLYLGNCLIEASFLIKDRYTVKEGTKAIAACAFDHSHQLTEVVLPDGLVTIGTFAFFGCVNLPSVTIPASVVMIGDHAFDEAYVKTIYGYTNTVARIYANEYGISFISLDTPSTEVPVLPGPPTDPEGNNATFYVQTVKGVKDQVVFVNVYLLETDTYIGAMDGKIEYDSTKLKLLANADDGSKIAVGNVITDSGAMYTTKGNRFAVASINGIQKSGLVFALAFQVLEDIPEGQTTVIDMSFTEVVHYTDDTYAYDLSVMTGGVTGSDMANISQSGGSTSSSLSGATGELVPGDTELPVVTPDDVTNGDVTPDKTVYGDINGDGRLDATDALLALKAAVGKVELTEEQCVVAEVSGDGKLDAVDALLILQRAVMKIDQFPVEK